MMMVQDLCLLWPLVKALPGVRGRKLCLHGKGEGAVAMLCHALLQNDPEVGAVVLEELPASFLDTAWQIMGVLRMFDISHAVGLLAPTPVVLINPSGMSYTWYFANRVFERLGHTGPTIVHHGEAAFRHILAVLDRPA